MSKKVHLRIVGHHALVHTVKSEAHAIGAPEEATMDTKLITVHALSVHNLARTIGGNLHVILLSISKAHVELIAIDIGCMTRRCIETAGLILTCTTLAPHLFLLLEVNEATLTAKV